MARGNVLRLWEHAGISGKLKVTLPKGMYVAGKPPFYLRGEVNGDPIEISSGAFNCDVKGYAPASFILQ